MEKFGKTAAAAAAGLAAEVLEAGKKAGKGVAKAGSAAMKKVIDEIDDADWKKLMKEMGKKTDIAASAAKEMAKKSAKAFGGVSKMTKAAIEDAGSLLKSFDESELGEITKETFKESAEAFGKLGGWTAGQAKKLAAKSKEAFGDVSVWTADSIKKVGNVLEGLDDSDLDKITKDTFKDSAEAFGKVAKWSATQAKTLAKKSKEAFGDVSKWTAESIKKVGSVMEGLDRSDIDKISKDTFKASAETFGKVAGWSADQAKTLAKKSKEAFGDVSKWTAASMKQVGTVVQGLELDEVAKISATALAGMTKDAVKNSLKTLGKVSKFGKKQAKQLAEKVVEAYPVVEDWTKDRIEEMGTIVKGVDATKLEKISKDSFKAAIGTFKSVSKDAGKKIKKAGAWTKDQLTALGKVAKESYGESKAFTEKTLADLGDIAAGLTEDDIKNIPKEAVKGLDDLAIINMDETQVKAFDADKIKEMPVKTKKAINGNKLRGLKPTQVKAAVCGDDASKCPNYINDVKIAATMDPTVDNTAKTTQIAADICAGAGKPASDCEVLTVLEVETSSRRLQGRGLSTQSTTEVTVRASASSQSDANKVGNGVDAGKDWSVTSSNPVAVGAAVDEITGGERIKLSATAQVTPSIVGFTVAAAALVALMA
jgi:hypothetical protein